MFEGFSQETGDFLWELSFHNERPWFLAHKEQFLRVLDAPFKALGADCLALMRQRLPERELRLHVSRIYRDARRLFGRGPYKDHLWFILYEGDKHENGPCFWFELGAATYSYGMGFWEATPSQTEAYRRLIDANPAAFERLIRPIEAKKYRLYGAEYKRPKAQREPPVSRWYNRRSLSVGMEKDFGGDALSERLPLLVADCFEELLPLYDFLWAAFRAAKAADAEERF